MTVANLSTSEHAKSIQCIKKMCLETVKVAVIIKNLQIILSALFRTFVKIAVYGTLELVRIVVITASIHFIPTIVRTVTVVKCLSRIRT